MPKAQACANIAHGMKGVCDPRNEPSQPSGEQAHAFVRALVLSHMDAFLKVNDDARLFLSGDVVAELASRSIAASAHKP
jgi:hypothetical protein